MLLYIDISLDDLKAIRTLVRNQSQAASKLFRDAKRKDHGRHTIAYAAGKAEEAKCLLAILDRHVWTGERLEKTEKAHWDNIMKGAQSYPVCTADPEMPLDELLNQNPEGVTFGANGEYPVNE